MNLIEKGCFNVRFEEMNKFSFPIIIKNENVTGFFFSQTKQL